MDGDERRATRVAPLALGPLALPDWPAGDAAAAEPQRAVVLPAPDAEGLLTGRDGRMFAVPDPAALVERLNAQPAEARIDFDHETEPMSRTYLGSTRAQGWARDWRVEADGAISALLDLHAPALGAVQRREYRYLSPAVAHSRRGVISGISSVGLVNNPNLHVPALSAEEDPMKPSDPQPGAEGRTQALDAREQALAQREEQIVAIHGPASSF